MSGKVVVFNHPLMTHKLAIIRNEKTNTKDFRETVSEIANLMAYEATRDLPVKEVEVKTPIAVSKTTMIDGDIVIVPILRAGLAMHNGVLDFFDGAENCFVSAYRKYTDETYFDIHVEYIAAPSLDGKTVIERIAWLPVLFGNSSVRIINKLLRLEYTAELESEIRRKDHLGIAVVKGILRGSCLCKTECHLHVTRRGTESVHVGNFIFLHSCGAGCQKSEC